MFISAVQQSDSYIYIHILFHILFHYSLSQDIEYSSLCSTVGPCCWSSLYILVCICSPSLPIHPSPLATKSLFSMSVKSSYSWQQNTLVWKLDICHWGQASKRCEYLPAGGPLGRGWSHPICYHRGRHSWSPQSLLQRPLHSNVPKTFAIFSNPLNPFFFFFF